MFYGPTNTADQIYAHLAQVLAAEAYLYNWYSDGQS